MAKEDKEMSVDEAKELERLLSDEGIASIPGAGPAGGLAGNKLVGKILELYNTKKTVALIIAGVLLLALIGGGVALYFTLTKPAPVEVKEEPVAQPAKEEEEEVILQKVNAYKLEPFFIPLLKDNEETGEFVSIATTLLLSNNKLDREIDKNLSIMRKNIYYILRRKQPEDFKGDQKKLEERLKKEIMTAVNTLLLSGTGTVTDVYFTQFIVK